MTDKSVVKLSTRSNDPLWLKVIEEFTKIKGEAASISWLSKIDFEIIDKETVNLSSNSKFIVNYIETKYLNQLKTIIKKLSLGKFNKVNLSHKKIEVMNNLKFDNNCDYSLTLKVS
jgi:chromosomal replication initiation ATPase DnaA